METTEAHCRHYSLVGGYAEYRFQTPRKSSNNNLKRIVAAAAANVLSV